MRPSWKLPFIALRLFSLNNNKIIKTRIRNSIVPATFEKKKIYIYNGIFYKSRLITQHSVGLKLGEFSFTKPIDTQIHVKKKKKKEKKRK